MVRVVLPFLSRLTLPAAVLVTLMVVLPLTHFESLLLPVTGVKVVVVPAITCVATLRSLSQVQLHEP